MSPHCVRVALLLGLLSLVAGCSTSPNSPLNHPAVDALAYSTPAAPMPPSNQPTLTPAPIKAHAQLAHNEALEDDNLLIGITFSGGGTRAAAYGYGVLKEIEATQVNVYGHQTSLFEHIDILSGVSGGSVLAGYIGLRGRDGLADFRERFLIRDAEEKLNVNLGLSSIGAALSAGVNDQSRLPKWLDDNLFHGATMRDLEHTRPEIVHIYATDLYNRQPFVFSHATFDALCSDYESYPLSHAVAASAAVPIVFAPIVLESFPTACKSPVPPWVNRALGNRNESEMLRSAARGFLRNRNPAEVRYVKLVDGGLTDNIGVTGFVIEHGKDLSPYSPLSPKQAVMINRALFLVANGGPSPTAPWARTLEGPNGIEMVNALSDAAIRSNVRANFDTFRKTFQSWREELVRWRCSLPSSRVLQLRGSLAGWNCHDVQFFIAELGFDQLGPERLKALSAVATRFKLPQDQVDMLITAGRDVLRQNETFRDFLQSLKGPKLFRPRAPERTREAKRVASVVRLQP